MSEQRQRFITYVPREWLAQLKQFLPPQGRFVERDESAGVVLFSYCGEHVFRDEVFQPPLPPETLTEAERDQIADRQDDY